MTIHFQLNIAMFITKLFCFCMSVFNEVLQWPIQTMLHQSTTYKPSSTHLSTVQQLQLPKELTNTGY